MDIEFRDIFASGISAACLGLIYLGKDSNVASILLAIVGFYFGSKTVYSVSSRRARGP